MSFHKNIAKKSETDQLDSTCSIMPSSWRHDSPHDQPRRGYGAINHGEPQVPKSVGTTTQVEGVSEIDLIKLARYQGVMRSMPALIIAIFLASADQTIVVSSYGKIGSELKALSQTSWIATSWAFSSRACTV